MIVLQLAVRDDVPGVGVVSRAGVGNVCSDVFIITTGTPSLVETACGAVVFSPEDGVKQQKSAILRVRPHLQQSIS